MAPECLVQPLAIDAGVQPDDAEHLLLQRVITVGIDRTEDDAGRCLTVSPHGQGRAEMFCGDRWTAVEQGVDQRQPEHLRACPLRRPAERPGPGFRQRSVNALPESVSVKITPDSTDRLRPYEGVGQGRCEGVQDSGIASMWKEPG